MDSYLNITEVARRTGLSAHTLRYYERIGLIATIARAAGGQRRYAASDMDWLGFLMRLRATNMPIQRMQEFARLRTEGNSTAGKRRKMLEDHLSEVLLQIQTLQQAGQVLQSKIAFYRQIEQSSSQDEVSLVKGNTDEERTLPKRAGQTK